MEGQKKRGRYIKDDDDNNTDRLSDLPDHLLLHIMEFINIKQALQTCVLSHRWKHLWKRLTNLALHHSYPQHSSDVFCKFVSHILSRRDAYIPLHNLDFKHLDLIDPPIFETTLLEVIKYAASHNVQQLAINVLLKHIRNLQLPPSIFDCPSLTSLKLIIYNPYCTNRTMFPKSFNLPTLKYLHLKYLTFTTSDNGFAEPFSTCKMLNTLVVQSCYLQDDAQTLCISNSKLSSLTIGSSYLYEEAHNYKVVLCTPKLTSLTTTGRPTFLAPSARSLPFLEQVNISYAYFHKPYEGLFLSSWLQLLANVKIITLCLTTLVEIVELLSSTGSMNPPCFVRLKSLNLKADLRQDASMICDVKVRRMATYLLQNSPPARVDIIRHA